MKKIASITTDDAEYGFRLAGIIQSIADKKDLITVLKKISKDPDIGLIIIDERLLDAGAEEKIREIEQRWDGVLLFLPSPERAEVEIEDYAIRLMRRAIGYHVRLKV
jgi:V/A-type H+-transporting ATPase subunit F